MYLYATRSLSGYQHTRESKLPERVREVTTFDAMCANARVKASDNAPCDRRVRVRRLLAKGQCDSPSGS